MLEHIPGLPDLILFWMNDVSVIRVSRCGITRGMLFGKHVLTLIWMIMTDGLFKIVSNWAVLTPLPPVQLSPSSSRLNPRSRPDAMQEARPAGGTPSRGAARGAASSSRGHGRLRSRLQPEVRPARGL